MTEGMNRKEALDAALELYLQAKRTKNAADDALKQRAEKLMELVRLEEGGVYENGNGVRAKYTPESTNLRFDYKGYLKAHPDAKEGYMVESTRKASVRVTEPKADETDEWGWEK